MCIPITVKWLLISKCPSSYLVISWHSQMCFAAVILRQSCILLDHERFWKIFEKSRILSRIYPEYFHQHHHTKMAYIMLESKSYFTSSARWQERKFLMSFVYTNIIKKCLDRHTPSKFKLLEPLQKLHSIMSFIYVIRYRSGEGIMRWI